MKEWVPFALQLSPTSPLRQPLLVRRVILATVRPQVAVFAPPKATAVDYASRYSVRSPLGDVKAEAVIQQVEKAIRCRVVF